MTKTYSRSELDARIEKISSEIKDLVEKESQGENVSEEKIKKMGERWYLSCLRANKIHNQMKEDASTFIKELKKSEEG